MRLPEDLKAALEADAQAREVFERLPSSHRWEYVRWIAEAKKAETHARRIAKALDMLRAGETVK
jgi:uncharacterized protein YdeI (YjbR/CyaY-like superfamily)